MKKKLILGLGMSGRAALGYLLKKGEAVICVDKNASTLRLDPLFHNVDLFGEEENIPLDEVDSIVKSPGIAWSHPLLQWGVRNKIPVGSEIELALSELASKKKTLFGITGSNGKTTTTLLTTHILQQSGFKTLAAGNVGRSLLSEIEGDHEIIVVELSSFQLETLSQPVFDAGCILNITPNHLDRYASFEEYAKTKFRLLKSLKRGGKLFLFEKELKEFEEMIEEEYKENIATIFRVGYRDGGKCVAAHDLQNLEAAYAFATHAGVKEEDVWKAFSSFVKPPHRIEFVRLHRGVRYINDSKATSSDAVQKALEAMQSQVVLIAGGLDKKGEFKSLQKILREKVRKVFLIGSSASKISSELQDCVSVEVVETLECAIQKAELLAEEGESVLFSPGCASYDQFRNYEHRGDVFKQLVNELGSKG